MHDPIDNHPQEMVFHEYLDNELSSNERERFEDHLSGCQKCTQTLSALEELFAQIESIPPIKFTNGIFYSVVEEINHFTRIEPLIKQTAWVQFGIISILTAALLSLVSIETIQSSLSNALINLRVSIATNVSTISKFIASLPSQFPSLEIQFFHPWDLVSANYLSVTLLLTITLVSGLLWFVGNKILLPNSSISHSPNGG